MTNAHNPENVMDDAKSLDLAEACVYGEFHGTLNGYMKHGILPDYECCLSEDIHSVICTETQSPTVHYSNGCRLYYRTTVLQDFTLNCTCDQLLKTNYKSYVGVCRHCLKLFDNNFQCFYETDCCVNILSALCNEKSGEIITAGPGNITIWRFRQRARIIVPHRTITDGLHLNDVVSHLCLEDSPQDQRLFAVVCNGVKVFSFESGQMLMESAHMHAQPITALLHFRSLNCIITGAKDGTVKVWNASLWQLDCTFVGHHAQITSIAPYPYGPMILSASRDSTVRVWNLLTHDQVDILQHDSSVEGLICKRAAYTVLCYTKNRLIGRKVHQLYRKAAVIGREISFLKATKDPRLPIKVIASCADSAVRMVSPRGGHIITTALLPVERSILSLGYISFTEMLYVLDTAGMVHVYDTRTNPSTLKTTYSPSVGKGKLTCLCVYEAILDQEDKEEALANDKWLKVILEAKQISRYGHRAEEPEKGIRFLLGGTDTGHLVVLDLQTVGISFSVKGQEDRITMVVCNPKKQLVISAGTGNLIQVWQIYPHVQELLSLQCSFCIASTPSLIITLAERLVFACNSTDLAMYTIDVYSLTQNSCFPGHPACSHTDAITGLDSFPKLNIIASCARDHTVRVWTEDNQLIRVLQMDSIPYGLAFCTFQGDIIIELHCHLHIISNTTYFTDSLLKQFLSLNVSEPVEQSWKGFSIDISILKPEDCQRLQINENHIEKDESGVLFRRDMEESLKAEQERAAALLLINSRNEELKKIRNGSITSKKKGMVATTSGDKERAWRELLQILHPELTKPTICLPEVDDFDPDTYNVAQQNTSNQSTPYHKGPKLQFFPPLATFSPPYPIAPDGYIPNSSILQKLRKSEADQMLAQQWKPIVLSPKQFNEIAENVQNVEEEAVAGVSTSLRDKLQAALTADSETPKSLSPSPPPTPPPPRPIRVIAPLKKIEKLVAPKKAKTPTPPRIPTPPPSPPRLPTPPPPPPPLPDFIAQFVGRPWFEKLFPTSESRASFPTMTVKVFSSTLLSCFSKTTDSMLKADICLALSKLFTEKDPPDGNAVYRSIIAQLLGPPPICYTGPGERQFVMQALKLIFVTNMLDTTLAELLLFYYAHGDSVLQQLITNYLLRKGLNDPFAYFPTVIEQNLSAAPLDGISLLSTCKEWFQEWIKQLSLIKQSKQSSSGQPTNAKVRGTKKTISSQSKIVPECSEKQIIEVINYLIAIEHENELSRQKPPSPPPQPSPEPQDVTRNAVIALPKLHLPPSLVRLGETHRSCCHPERETTYSLICQLPHLSVQQGHRGQATAYSLSLAVKRQNINPFLTEDEKPCERKGVSLTSIVRYFVPGSSYVKDS